MNILALDIGGTAVKHAYFNRNGVHFDQFHVKDCDGKERLLKKLIDFIGNYEVDCVGVSVPGPFEFETGTSLMEHKLKSIYKISLKNSIETTYPKIKTVFIHDATAFVMGEISLNSILSKENISAVMIGTGLGYAHAINGKIEINQKETPLRPLWNKPYKDGICEDYVSASAIIKRAKKLGYVFDNVLDIANTAKAGNLVLKKLFEDVGKDLGHMVNLKKREDNFNKLIIGGQVSLSWDLMKTGFESTSNIEYYVSEKPAISPLYGVKYCVENKKENVFLRGENDEKGFNNNC